MEHLAACDRCREFFERDAHLGQLLAGRDLGGRVSVHLRERVYDALACERTCRAHTPFRSRRRRWLTGVALGVVTTAVIAVALSFRSGSGWATATLFADDFQSMILAESMGPPTVDSVEVERFFAREIGHHIVPVQVRNADLKRMILCRVAGRRGAMSEYDLGGVQVAYYQIPLRPEGEGEANGRVSPMEISSAMGVQVVRWADGEYEHALVSELPRDRLAAMAALEFRAD